MSWNDLNGSKFLMLKGANLFMKNKRGDRVIDRHVDDNPKNVVLGPQVLQRALDLRWSSVKHLLFISNFYETSDVVPFSSSSSTLALIVEVVMRYWVKVTLNLSVIR
jgi:hypothetical protein